MNVYMHIDMFPPMENGNSRWQDSHTKSQEKLDDVLFFVVDILKAPVRLAITRDHGEKRSPIRIACECTR